MNDRTLVALGLHYEDLAAELRAEIIRTAENNPSADRLDFIADIARRFDTMTHDAPEFRIVWINQDDEIIDPAQVDDPDDKRQVLQCPHCNAVDPEVREVDMAERWNSAEGVLEQQADGLHLVLEYGTGDGDFSHDHYECGVCDRRVELPSGVTEDESWD